MAMCTENVENIEDDDQDAADAGCSRRSFLRRCSSLWY